VRVRLGLHTAVYILSVSLVMAAALNPVGTARVLRRQVSRIAAVVRAVPATAAAAAAAPPKSASPTSPPSGLIGSAARPRAADR
jgi:hypothetical protein